MILESATAPGPAPVESLPELDDNPWATVGCAVARAGRLAIIGCSATKRPGTHPARELYEGGLFLAARRDVEARGVPWLVLSAMHGLVPTTDYLESYEMTMAQRKRESGCKGCGRACNRGWCYLRGYVSGVDARLRQVLGRSGSLEVEVHAGSAYVDVLEACVVVQAGHVRLLDPCRGMQIGQRLAWYSLRRRTAVGAQLELWSAA